MQADFSARETGGTCLLRLSPLMLDAIRITFPPLFSIESLPAAAQETLPRSPIYSLKTESTPNTFTVRRTLVIGDILVLRKDYPQLRSFYGKFETKDQESVVLKVGSTRGQTGTGRELSRTEVREPVIQERRLSCAFSGQGRRQTFTAALRSSHRSCGRVPLVAAPPMSLPSASVPSIRTASVSVPSPVEGGLPQRPRRAQLRSDC